MAKLLPSFFFFFFFFFLTHFFAALSLSSDEFRFTHNGRLELNVSKISLSQQPAGLDPDLSRVGFFLCTRDSRIHVFQQLEEGEIGCALKSDLVYTFDQLKTSDHFSTVFHESDADQYTLLFANCLQPLCVSDFQQCRSACSNCI